ncbi:TIGR02301 family protein [Consotaella aegiceratis]|uniref:TIGR02301 family protein n=1 Tax=Consotaella aegiceratis TaxID=3097961 RepID=UPI002F41A63C
MLREWRTLRQFTPGIGEVVDFVLMSRQTMAMMACRFSFGPAAGLALAMVLVGPVCSRAEEAGATPDAAPEAVQPSNAPFMKPLSRLSSILGSVHFLRKLCSDPNASAYRDEMAALIDAQKPNEADRRILVSSFNSGYRAFESTYRTCTPAARIAVQRYQKEGIALSREISARYGN